MADTRLDGLLHALESASGRRDGKGRDGSDGALNDHQSHAQAATANFSMAFTMLLIC